MPNSVSHNERRYHQLLENLNDAVYTVDLNGYFTSVNKAGEAITGYSKKELQKINFIEVVSPEYLHLVKKKIAQKLKQDTPTIYEIEIVKKDGTRLPVEISSRAVYKDGEVVEILGIARDITERKQLEHQKEVFLSLLTHEIKNPLTTIKGYTQLLGKTPNNVKNGKRYEYVKVIDQQIDSLVNLMNDFLEVSRVRMNRFSISKELNDMDEVIDEAIVLFSKNNTHRIIRKGRKAGILSCDRNRILQVLVNLISNAIKYSPNSSVIEIEVIRDAKNLAIRVRDFGEGIQKTHIKKIFELFYRIDHPRNTSIKGYGLGLFICREIIKSHKGRIWVESKVGEGSSFYFSLPVSRKN